MPLAKEDPCPGNFGSIFFGGGGMAYLSFPMGINGLGMSFCNPGASFCSVVSQALPATLFSIVAALLLSMARTQELSSQEMRVHYQPSYPHQNPVNHSDLQGPPVSLVNKGPMSAIAFYSLFFFFLEWGFLITQLCMQTLKEH